MTVPRSRVAGPTRALTGVLAGCLVAALAGCTGTAARGADGTVDVVATSYPLQWLAEQLAGPDVRVTGLLPPGGDVHGFEPDPRQVTDLVEADVVVHLSGGLQPSLDEVLAQDPPERLVDAAAVADLDGDPHVWLDPQRLAAVAEDLEAALAAAAAPGSADDVARRGAGLQATLEALDADYAAALAPCRGATLVTAHEAFGYLAERYGLRQVGIAGIDPGVEPTPARLREVAGVVREAGVRTVFFEAATAPAVARTLAEETGAGTDVLHPVEQVAEGEDYLGLMRGNLDALRRGLVCG